MAEEKKKEIVEASLVEVPTQTTIAFKMEDDSLLDEKGILLKMYNKICKIEKSIA